MAAAFGIVKNHEGWITVSSELGKGTAVRIYLPAFRRTKVEQPVTQPPKMRLNKLINVEQPTMDAR